MSPTRFLAQPLPFGPEDLRRLAYQDPARFPVLLDSAAEGPLGRFSILACLPRYALWQDGRGLLHLEGAAMTAAGPIDPGEGFLSALERLWQRECVEPTSGELHPPRSAPFHGGWLVYLGYELAAEIEPKLHLPPSSLRTHAMGPGAFALRIPAALVFDHQTRSGRVVVEADQVLLLPELTESVRAVHQCASPLPAADPDVLDGLALHEEDPELFGRAVDQALEHIRAGDIYQANLSRQWRGQWTQSLTAPQLHSRAAALYEQLRQHNPAPFAALASFREWRLLSSSPERLVRVGGGQVETRPIAGTRPRSRLPEADTAEIAALIAHPKERAEHIMLVDLERNDLGRICRAGSVRADELMCTESYAHVHHIVSNVCGELNEGLSPIDVLRAVFPGGSITGCPKFRCMQIIAALERAARGAYTGALGYINRDGSMDLNILIRTITMDPNGLEFRAGAGIVADSDRQLELQETRAKARGLIAALRSR